MHSGNFSPDEMCDRYRIVRLIASGGAGEVYEAIHEFTGRTVALKCLQLRLTRRDDLRERMRLEAIVLCKIRHANVVAVHDAGISDDGTVWIAMELLVGHTLRELMRDGNVSIPQALYYAAGIADGVEAAHELHVVHRDLKPENVFITESSGVKVLDLGTAKFHGYGLKTTDKMRTIGTPAYMSPEHLRGAHVDVRADVYALGLIAYEMMVGVHPFAADDGREFADLYELAALHLFADPRPLPDRIAGFPEHVWQVIQRAIAKDRDARHSSMAEFAADLRNARTRFLKERDSTEPAAQQVTPIASPLMPSSGPLVSPVPPIAPNAPVVPNAPVISARSPSNFPPSHPAAARSPTAITMRLATVGNATEPSSDSPSQPAVTRTSTSPSMGGGEGVAETHPLWSAISVPSARDPSRAPEISTLQVRSAAFTPPGVSTSQARSAVFAPPGVGAPSPVRNAAFTPPGVDARSQAIAPISKPNRGAGRALVLGVSIGIVMGLLVFVGFRASGRGAARASVQAAAPAASSAAPAETNAAAVAPSAAPAETNAAPAASSPEPTVSVADAGTQKRSIESHPTPTAASEPRPPGARTADSKPPARTGVGAATGRQPSTGLPKSGL